MGAAVLLILTASMALVLIRAMRGPGTVDRVLGVNALGTITVLWLAAFGTTTGDGDVIDIAMIYALTSFVATIAVLKYLEDRDRGSDPPTRSRESTDEPAQ